MNLKNYERYFLFNHSIIILVLLITFILYYAFNSFVSKYLSFQCVFNDSNKIEVFVSKKDYKLLCQNSSLYIDQKKYAYKFENISKLSLNGKKYYSVQLSLLKDTNYKVGDISTIHVFMKKEKLIDIFKIIWKDDLDGKT